MNSSIITLIVAAAAIVIALIVEAVLLVSPRVKENRGNKRQPLLSRDCRIIAKRLLVQSVVQKGGHYTSYYVTFEFPDGSREEFKVGDKTYGLLAEGDWGSVHSQGSWFRQFERVTKEGSIYVE